MSTTTAQGAVQVPRQGRNRTQTLTEEQLQERFTAPEGVETVEDALRLIIAGGRPEEADQDDTEADK